MYWKKISITIIIIFIITLNSSAKKDSFQIKKIIPENPFIGAPFMIEGKNFGEHNNLEILFNDEVFTDDYFNITYWDNNYITFTLPDLPTHSNLTLKRGDYTIRKAFTTKRLLEAEYFNPVKYRVEYKNEVSFTTTDEKVFIYVPQPLISDILTNITIIKTTPEPDYIQDNGVLIYEFTNQKSINFNFIQELEVVTWYKKFDIDQTCDEIPYITDTPFYKHWTRSEPPFVIPHDPVIKKLLTEIIDKDDSHRDKVTKICNWVAEKMTHSYPPEDRRPKYAIETGKGDCLSDAYLLTSLMRSAGIPIRLHSGIIFYHTWNVGGRHFWEEVFIPGIGWIPIDMSFRHVKKFLEKHDYPTNTTFYRGGLDGRRMTFSEGRIKILKPDDKGTLVYEKHLDNLQVPHTIAEEKKDFKMKSRLSILEITNLYTDSEDWFKFGK